MRVLATLTYYHPHWTGLSTFATRIAEGLAARGHDVTVVTTRHSPALPADEWRAGVHIVRLRPWAHVSRGAIVPAWPTTIAPLIDAHDVVHLHTPQAEAGLIAHLAARRSRPVVMTHHGDLVMPAGAFNRLVERAVTASMSTAGRLARVVVPLSADYAAASPFLRQFASTVRPISPPVDLPAPRPHDVKAWRDELGLTGHRVIGFAGRFVEEKGFDFLLRAVPALLNAEPRTHFVFAGEHRVAYEAFFAHCRGLWEPHARHLTMVGLITDPQRLANFYAMCDVFALPSRTDCFAAVQVEAMLSGTPVVASDIPGAREVVTRTGMGRLCAPGDPQALADALIEVAQQRPRYLRSRDTVRAIYDPVRAIDDYEALLREIVA